MSKINQFTFSQKPDQIIKQAIVASQKYDSDAPFF